MIAKFPLGAALAAGVVAACVSGAFGATVIIDRLDASTVHNNGDPMYAVAPGGEFTVVPSDTTLLSLYTSFSTITDPHSGVSPDVGFQTFCLEENVSVDTTLPTGPLGYVVSNSILNGEDPNGNFISLGTAWLYSQFASGNLALYAYSGQGASVGFGATSPRSTDAALLQNAIWNLQGYAVSVTGNPYYGLLTTSTASGGLGLSASGIAVAYTANNGAYGVSALNIGAASTVPPYSFQAMLVLSRLSPPTVPDGGMTVVLLGLAAGGVVLIRRALIA